MTPLEQVAQLGIALLTGAVIGAAAWARKAGRMDRRLEEQERMTAKHDAQIETLRTKHDFDVSALRATDAQTAAALSRIEEKLGSLDRLNSIVDRLGQAVAELAGYLRGQATPPGGTTTTKPSPPRITHSSE